MLVLLANSLNQFRLYARPVGFHHVKHRQCVVHALPEEHKKNPVKQNVIFVLLVHLVILNMQRRAFHVKKEHFLMP